VKVLPRDIAKKIQALLRILFFLLSNRGVDNKIQNPRTHSTKIELKKQPSPSCLKESHILQKKGYNKRRFLEEFVR
jgi:hypothetical protein